MSPNVTYGPVSGMGHSPEVRAALAVVCAADGQRTRAEAVLTGLKPAAAGEYVSPTLAGQVGLALGDTDGALADIERAIDARAVEVIWLDVRPVYAPLRSDPRFAALIARRNASRRLATVTGA